MGYWRQFGRELAIVGLAMGCFVVILAFFVTNYLTLATPTTKSATGWVSILQSQPTIDANSTQGQFVQLSVDWDEPLKDVGSSFNDYSSPLVDVSISVCGGGAFHGLLLLGGSARLDDPTKGLTDKSANPFTISGQVRSDFPGLKGSKVELFDHVQAFHYNVADPPECDKGNVSPSGGLDVEGAMRGPILNQPAFLGLRSARYSEVWPEVGSLKNPSDYGPYLLPGQSGSFDEPTLVTNVVEAPRLDLGSRIDQVEPAPDSTQTNDLSLREGIRWTSRRPISPVATIENTDLQTRLSETNAFLGIVFGVVAGVIGALIIEAFKREPTSSPADSSTMATTAYAPKRGVGASRPPHVRRRTERRRKGTSRE